MSRLRVGSGLSTDLGAPRAVAEAATEAVAALGGDPPDLVIAFISEDHREGADEGAKLLAERFPSAAVIGCTAQGVIAGARELEAGPAVAVWMATLPDTTVEPFWLDFVEVGEGEGTYNGWPEHLPPDAALLMLVDRFSFPAGHLLQKLNEERPTTRVVGGIATGGRQPGESRLLLGGRTIDRGAVAVAIYGRARVETLVSQGCRPVGSPVTITRADRNMIFELAGSRPVDHIGEIWKKASPRDRGLMASRPLQIGLVVDEYKTELGPGDFLLRPVIGAEPETGAVAVGDIMNVGSTVQFHVADPETADEDLRLLVESIVSQPAGALLFTCQGRGTNMFDQPDHDASVITKALGAPLAGFSCAGELGPVGGRNFLHGMTAAVALFVDTQV